MSIAQLDTETADLDLQAAIITALTDTPHADEAMICQGLITLYRNLTEVLK